LFYHALGSVRLTHIPDPLINSIYRIGQQGMWMVEIVIFLLLIVIYENTAHIDTMMGNINIKIEDMAA